MGDLGATPATAVLGLASVVIYVLPAGLLLVLLAAIYLLRGNASAAPLNAHHVLPTCHGLTSVVLIVNNFFLYARVEVNAVYVDELRDAPREFRTATLLAVVLILLVFIIPTLAISVAVPAPHVSFAEGVMQAFKSLLDQVGLSVLTIAVGLVVASVSGLLDWRTGPLYRPAGHRSRACLPTAVLPGAQLERVQLHVLVAQGVIITVIGVLYALVPAVSRAYRVFAAVAMGAYLNMYVFKFVAAITNGGDSRSTRVATGRPRCR